MKKAEPAEQPAQQQPPQPRQQTEYERLRREGWSDKKVQKYFRDCDAEHSN